MRLRTLGILAAAAAGVCLAATDPQADSVVSLDTIGGGSWQVTRTLVGGESDSYAGTAAVVTVSQIPGNGIGAPGSWVAAGTINSDATALDTATHTAQWVSYAANTGVGYAGDANKAWTPGSSTINGTEYTYSDTFTMTTVPPGSAALSLQGVFSSDNWFHDAELTWTDGNGFHSVDLASYVTGLPGGVTWGTAYEYTYAYGLDLTLNYNFTSPQTFTLIFDSVNNDQYTNPTDTGFIFAGTAAAAPVPVPAAVWTGISTLLGLAGLALLRRRRLA